jgi:hypothetical protein
MFAKHGPIIEIVAKGIALPEASHYICIREDCLAIFENICSHITVRGTIFL